MKISFYHLWSQAFIVNYFTSFTPVKRQTQYPYHARAVVPHGKFGPTIREAAQFRRAVFSAIKLAFNPRPSQTRPGE
jgi:hypothetical protein